MCREFRTNFSFRNKDTAAAEWYSRFVYIEDQQYKYGDQVAGTLNCMNVICSQNLPRLSVTITLPHQSCSNWVCRSVHRISLTQPARKHPWAVWCWHPLFARGSTVLAIVKEVQKITRPSGTVYICGRAEWGQHGGSVVVSSQNDSWKGVCDGRKVGVGGGGRLGVSGGGGKRVERELQIKCRSQDSRSWRVI